MIVDCHTHINSTADGSILTDEHLAAMETVDVCLVLANPDNSSGDVNDKLSEYVTKHREKMVGFAFVNPTIEDTSIKKLASMPAKLGLSGVVLHCSVCGFHPAHSRAMQFYEVASELSLPVFFHNAGHLGPEAVLDYAQPYLLDEVARTFPSLKIIIGTMGVPFVEQTLSLVAKHQNVYADLTIKPSSVWQVYNMVVAAYERGVMDKLLFGSGFPLAKAEQCIETLLGFNKLLADSELPIVPRGSMQSIVERDTLSLLAIKRG
jgi:uncharacterized protein